MRNLITIAFLVLFTAAFAGCNTSGPVTVTETECAGDATCPAGTYCDPFLRLCGWDCTTDVQCEPGMYCSSVHGRCLREETPPPPPDMSPLLEITAGPMEDLTVLAGTADAELLRFTIVNRSAQPVWITELPIQIAPLSGFGLGGVLGELKVRNERTRVTVMGPINLEGALIDTTHRFFDAFQIPAGESVELAVRVDLQAGAATEFDLVLGASGGTLGLNPIFADTSIGVDPDRIAGNVSIVRHINVRSEADVMAPDSGAVSVFMLDSGRRQTIDAGTPEEVALFIIAVMNGTDQTVRASDLRIRVTTDDGRPWAEDGLVVLGAIDVYDGRDGSFLLAPPGASGCGTNGCTFIFDGISLAPGEGTILQVRARMNAPGRRLFMAVGESFSSGAETGPGAIFHRIASAAGDVLPIDMIVGNTAGFYYLASR